MLVDSLREYDQDLYVWRCPLCGYLNSATYGECRHWRGLARQDRRVKAIFEEGRCHDPS